MKGRWLANLVLLVLVLLLAAAIRHELTESRMPPTLTELVASEMLLIEINREGEPKIELARSPQGWRMERPLRVDANSEQVESLLAILNTPVHRSFPEQAAALEELDLAPPRLRLRLDTLELAVGGIDPLGQHRYVASGGLVHLIDDRFYHLLIAPPIDYVSPRLLPRGFVPIFGRMEGAPLDLDSLTALAEVVAERVESRPGNLEGSPVELEAADGSSLSFLVSADRRRWGRLDADLLHVLTEGPSLAQDPHAIDPTPPPAVLAPDASTTGSDPSVPGPAAASDSRLEPPPFEASQDPFAPLAEAVEPLAPLSPPDLIVTDEDLAAPPAEVRLSPEADAPLPSSRGGPLRGEPDKEPPYGFGQDPFAPDPPPVLVQ